MWLAVGVLAACDAQVESDYPGQALVALQGSVVAAGPVAIKSMLIRWATDDPTGPGEAVSPLALTTSYPAQFTALILAEPPAAARQSLPDGPTFAEGYLFAFDAGGGTVGTDFGHALVWLAGPAGDGTQTAVYLGGATAAGFTVAERSETDALSAEEEILADRCVARAVGEGWNDTRAETTCRAAHAYRLLPAPQGIATRWQLHAVAGGP